MTVLLVTSRAMVTFDPEHFSLTVSAGNNGYAVFMNGIQVSETYLIKAAADEIFKIISKRILDRDSDCTTITYDDSEVILVPLISIKQADKIYSDIYNRTAIGVEECYDFYIDMLYSLIHDYINDDGTSATYSSDEMVLRVVFISNDVDKPNNILLFYCRSCEDRTAFPIPIEVLEKIEHDLQLSITIYANKIHVTNAQYDSVTLCNGKVYTASTSKDAKKLLELYKGGIRDFYSNTNCFTLNSKTMATVNSMKPRQLEE